MNNAQTLADLRYFAQHALPENRASFDSSLRDFAAALISPPAQKPASVPGGSGAGLVGNLGCAPFTMSGDAWESAAHHVIAIRQKQLTNADTWRQISDFLQNLSVDQS